MIVLQYACEDTLDPKIDNFFPYTSSWNRANPDYAGAKHFRSNSRVAAPRDGVPRDANDAATDTIPDDEASAIPSTVETRRFGMHESYDFYQLCQYTERNKGLYTADQKMGRNDQRGTRQNPNGNRRGLECPEERDYYPHWQPSPWVDIAVMTNEASVNPCNIPGTCGARCNFYLANTFNRQQKCYCDVSHTDTGIPVNNKFNSNDWNNRRWYNNKQACESKGFSWYCISLSDTATGMTLPYPSCVQTQYSRVNHLGNTMFAAGTNGVSQLKATNADSDVLNRVVEAIPQSASPNRFLWQIPSIPSASASWSSNIAQDYKSCTLRIRYNISTGDFPQWPDDALESDDPNRGKMVTALNNSRFEGDPRTPLFQDPYVYIGPGGDSDTAKDAFLSLAVNTNQYGRTFQDRSYVFTIKPFPTTSASYDPKADSPMVLYSKLNSDIQGSNGLIINLGVRGKRGNIVQTYPSTEYAFCPEQLVLTQKDWIHFQWTGSDYNPRRGCNDGEGGPPDPNNYVSNTNNDNARADRSNVCLMLTEAYNQPRDYAGYEQEEGLTFAQKQARAKATIVQESFCYDSTNGVTVDQCYNMLMRLCFLDQEDDKGALYLRSNKECLTEDELDAIADKNSREQHPLNCAKLNAKPYPYMDGGLVPAKKPGIFAYFSSRNNNFSNRNQPGVICVSGTGVNCLNDYYDAGLRTLQDNSEFSGATSSKSSSYCNDEANSGDGANNNGAASCIGTGGTNTIINGESFAIEQGDNDSSGDGDKKPCEEFGTFFKKSSVEEQVGLAIGLLFVGIFTSWSGYYMYNRYKASHGGESVFKGDKSWQKKPRENEMI